MTPKLQSDLDKILALCDAADIALFHNITPFFARTVKTAVETLQFAQDAIDRAHGYALCNEAYNRAESFRQDSDDITTAIQRIVTDCKEAGLIQ